MRTSSLVFENSGKKGWFQSRGGQGRLQRGGKSRNLETVWKEISGKVTVLAKTL